MMPLYVSVLSMVACLILVSSTIVIAAPVLMLASACAVAHAVPVLVYGHDHQQRHEQLLKSGIRGNVHVLSG
jgi:hypothetical protein